MSSLVRHDVARPVAGVRLATAAAGIRKPGRRDVTLIALDAGTSVAAIFTRNVFCAAPVQVAREHLARAMPRLLVINAGNANAGTGTQGLEDARLVCVAAGRALGCDAAAVLPFSTGVIGQRLPAEKLVAVLPEAIARLDADGWSEAADAIRTTDTVTKQYSATVTCGAHAYTVSGIAKGAGMIKPDMATMLAYVATDAAVAPAALTGLLVDVANRTFNRITIDGDTSTNDSCVLIATGQVAPSELLDPSHASWPALRAAVEDVCARLARAIVRDGEGATRLVTVHVRGGATAQDCLRAAYAVAESPLVKTALFAGDPNWGRILAAVGRSGIPGLRVADITIALDDCPIIAGGEPVAGYDEAVAARIMAGAEFEIRIVVGQGPASVSVLTCDLSYDYVKINAEYRS